MVNKKSRKRNMSSWAAAKWLRIFSYNACCMHFDKTGTVPLTSRFFHLGPICTFVFVYSDLFNSYSVSACAILGVKKSGQIAESHAVAAFRVYVLRHSQFVLSNKWIVQHSVFSFMGSGSFFYLHHQIFQEFPTFSPDILQLQRRFCFRLPVIKIGHFSLNATEQMSLSGLWSPGLEPNTLFIAI